MDSANTVPGFWKRQFASDVTSRQRRFDVNLGIILPLVCVLADPYVFKTWALDLFGPAFLKSYSLLGYSEIFIGIAALSLALTRQRSSPLLAGGLLAGGLFSGVLGCLLLPFSVMGIFFAGLGLFGFTPLFTSFALIRNAVRILQRAALSYRQGRRVWSCVAACTLILLIPLVSQFAFNHVVNGRIDTILSGTREDAMAASRQLRRVWWLVDFDTMVHRYQTLPDANQKQGVADAYKFITGDDIERQLED